MTTTEMAKMIGREGAVYFRDECTVSVQVVDVKISYGNVRCQVEPIAGCGTAWVDMATIRFYEEE